jgi:ParB/RepB/Spo0J family partition protein
LSEEIPLALMDDNPYNPRLDFDEDDIERLANSLKTKGLLYPIQVRRINDRFQVVCGHRRVRAARTLGLKTIRAEVGEFSDREMLEFSLVENLERRDISDFEKGLSFSRLAKEFNLPYSEIGRLVGFSKQHVSNLIRMTELFDEEYLSGNASVIPNLEKITEHHARLLSQIADLSTRASMLELVVQDNLSVRELQRIINKLRGWFDGGKTMVQGDPAVLEVRNLDHDSSDLGEIRKALYAEFQLPHKRDFKAFVRMHAFANGFSIYDDFPPYKRLKGSDAQEKETHWFFVEARNFETKLREISVQFYTEIAVATLYADYFDKIRKRLVKTVRGTVLFLKTDDGWKVLHEHWSRLDEDQQSASRPPYTLKSLLSRSEVSTS